MATAEGGMTLAQLRAQLMRFAKIATTEHVLDVTDVVRHSGTSDFDAVICVASTMSPDDLGERSRDWRSSLRPGGRIALALSGAGPGDLEVYREVLRNAGFERVEVRAQTEQATPAGGRRSRAALTYAVAWRE